MADIVEAGQGYAANFSELFNSLAEGRTPNIGETGLVNLEQLFSTGLEAIQLTRQYRAHAAELAGPFLVSVSTNESQTTDEPDQPALDAALSDPAVGQDSEMGGEEANADADTNSVIQPSADSGTSQEDTEPLVLNTEAVFLLNTLRKHPVGEIITRRHFNADGFDAIKPDRKKDADNMAYQKGMGQLRDAGLVERVSYGKFRLTEKGSTSSDFDFLV